MSKELDGRIALVENWTGIRPSTLWGDADLMGFPPSKLLSFVPRWSSDLNLMWELADKMSEDEQEQYARALLAFSGNDCIGPSAEVDIWIYDAFELTHATAEQKAIAYLKVKEGK